MENLQKKPAGKKTSPTRGPIFAQLQFSELRIGKKGTEYFSSKTREMDYKPNKNVTKSVNHSKHWRKIAKSFTFGCIFAHLLSSSSIFPFLLLEIYLQDQLLRTQGRI